MRFGDTGINSSWRYFVGALTASFSASRIDRKTAKRRKPCLASLPFNGFVKRPPDYKSGGYHRCHHEKAIKTPYPLIFCQYQIHRPYYPVDYHYRPDISIKKRHLRLL